MKNIYEMDVFCSKEVKLSFRNLNAFLSFIFLQDLLNLKSFEFKIPYAYYQIHQSFEENHRVKVAKSVITEILENDPERK